MTTFQILHADHHITADQLTFIQKLLARAITSDGFFIQQINIPVRAFGFVYSALYGPTAGDAPVDESDVYYSARGDRPWADRLLRAPLRPVSIVQAIGVREDDAFTLFTVYGGPLAPQHPDDPTNADPAASTKFWSEHALAQPLHCCELGCTRPGLWWVGDPTAIDDYVHACDEHRDVLTEPHYVVHPIE